MPRAERRERERRWRKSTDRKVPSISALRRFLVSFHDAKEEGSRAAGRAFIPSPSESLKGLSKINRDCLSFLQRYHPESVRGVERVAMRSDTAGYQWDLLRYYAEGKDERFGVIDFAVSADVTSAFRTAVYDVAEEAWQPLLRRRGDRLVATGQEWAEVCFVPSASARKKDGPTYRFLAIREPLAQLELEGMESDQAALPFPVIDYQDQDHLRRFKLFGRVVHHARRLTLRLGSNHLDPIASWRRRATSPDSLDAGERERSPSRLPPAPGAIHRRRSLPSTP